MFYLTVGIQQILSLKYDELKVKLKEYKLEMKEQVKKMDNDLDI